jgi:CDP-diacylglycerol--serine O-phosphatidyltransferase
MFYHRPIERDRRRLLRRARFRAIPVRTLVPNVITLLALCAGLTAIRLSVEDRLEWALAAIVFAAMLDGIDGRVARMLKGTSRFGAELDSLADFVNFGVAPALILYFWTLHELKSAGWIAALTFAICAALRLARFNVMIEDPNRPAWAGNYFVGLPAPAGAITVLLPIYVHFLGLPHFDLLAPVTFLYTLGIAFLMVSRLAGIARAGAAGLRRDRAVLCAVDLLSLGGAHHRHDHLSDDRAARLVLLPRGSAQDGGRRDRIRGACGCGGGRRGDAAISPARR